MFKFIYKEQIKKNLIDFNMQSHKFGVRYCAVKTCTHHCGTRDINIRFYQISNNPLWYEVLKKQQITTNRMICHMHFTAESFKIYEKKILFENAMPTIFGEPHLNQYAKASQIDLLMATIKELNEQAKAK